MKRGHRLKFNCRFPLFIHPLLPDKSLLVEKVADAAEGAEHGGGFVRVILSDSP